MVPAGNHSRPVVFRDGLHLILTFDRLVKHHPSDILTLSDPFNDSRRYFMDRFVKPPGVDEVSHEAPSLGCFDVFSFQNISDDLDRFRKTVGHLEEIAVEQVLFDGGRTGAGLDAARGVEAMATAGADEHALSLASQVATAYGQVLTAEAARSAAEGAAKAAAEDVARAERRREAGTVTNADVLSLQVHLAAMHQQVIEATGHAAVARAQLNRLRGAPVDAEFIVQEPAPSTPAGGREWSALAAEAIANRPELRRGEGGVTLAESGRRQAKSAWWPQVAAQAAYQYDGLNFSDRASSWVVGGEARWAFSTGMGERAAMRAAAAAEQRARASRDEARAAVQVEVLSAVRQLESAEARERVARATVAQAVESQRILRDRYEAGMAGVQDVLSASAAVLSAEMSRTSAVVDRIVAQAALDRAIGRRP